MLLRVVWCSIHQVSAESCMRDICRVFVLHALNFVIFFLSFPNQLLLGWYGLVYAMAGIAEAGRDREGTKQTAKLIIGGSESEIQGFSSNSVKIRDMMRYSCSICMSPFSCPVYSHLPQVSFCSFCIGGRTSVWWAVLGVDWLTGGGAEGNNWEKAHKSNNDGPK